MKIGVAFSGSGTGALSAHSFADELTKCSVAVEMLSATSLTALPLLLWSRGYDADEIEEWIMLFQSAHTPVCGLDELARMGLYSKPPLCDLAISCVDVATGVTVIYSDTLYSDAWNLKVYPLTGNEQTALRATISPYRECCPCCYAGMGLCDFAVRYGCPFFPLKMAGMERLMSVNFAGGENPSQIAADSLSMLTGKNADLHYTVKLNNITDLDGQIRTFVRERDVELYGKLLF